MASGSSTGTPYNRAMEAVRSIRHRIGYGISSADVQSEQRRNFSPYGKTSSSTGKNKVKSWTLKAVCLNDKEAKRVPCSGAEREALVQAGLGEKKICVTNVECSSEQFKSDIISSFPKLDGCGGFEFLRCIPNTKELEVIASTIAQSPKLLKSVIGNGRVFIRPIQQNLSMVFDQELKVAEVSYLLLINAHYLILLQLHVQYF